MNKKELIEKLSEKMSTSKAEAGRVFDMIIEMIIEDMKKGEKVTMNWNAVIGSGGRAKVGIHKWTNDKGETFTNNEIKKFYEPAEGPQGSKKRFEAGRF